MRDRWAILAALAVVAVPSVAAPLPVEQTRYGRAAFRLEGRTDKPMDEIGKTRAYEDGLSAAGIDARWVQIVDHHGSPLLANPWNPCDKPDPAGNERALKQWVADIHRAGMPAMTWYPLTFSESGWHAHPGWRQKSLLPYANPGTEQLFCCINSGYGDALIRYVNDAIGRLGLDGVWFDGSVWTGIWERPYPLTCVCDSCRTKFRKETGLALPDRIDWTSPAFRRWVQWRFDTFGKYVGTLARSIRAAHPGAAVVINHYHRPGIPWRSAVPLDRFDADIISGSEAGVPDVTDLTARLCRAYGRSQSEVWRPFDTPGVPEADAEPLMHNALAAYLAGALPSFGGDFSSPKVPSTAALFSPILKALRPYACPPSRSTVAFHVSQQAETFHFGREMDNSATSALFWSSLANWTNGLGMAHIPVDYLYDADLNDAGLARVRTLFMPISPALTDTQCAAVRRFVARGGTVLLGPGAGALDGMGERRKANPLAQAFGFTMKGVPAPDGFDSEMVSLTPVAGGPSLNVAGLRTPITRLVGPWNPLYRAGKAVAAAGRAYGKGTVLLFDSDPARVFGAELVEGGSTRLRVERETEPGNRWALHFTDGPEAPQTHYPDLEVRTPAFAYPAAEGGRVRLRMLMEPTGQASIEIRSSSVPIFGPIVQIGPGGAITASGQSCGSSPIGKWFAVGIDWDFARPGHPSKWRLTISEPGAAGRTYELATPAPDYMRQDWMVVYGPGTQVGSFRIDDLVLERRSADGSYNTILSQDFEAGPTGFRSQGALVQAVADLVRPVSGLPVTVQASPDIRVGLFGGKQGQLMVHLYNRSGRRTDWLKRGAGMAEIRSSRPIRSARRALTGTALSVRKVGGEWRIRVPVGLYEIVEVR